MMNFAGWVRLQLESTLNVEPSKFNDWFTGHLNFQIEQCESNDEFWH